METKAKLPSSSREMRNIAEKMRRDKLNNYVSELATIVPLVSGSNKRIDKTSVLRLAANYIRMHNILGDPVEKSNTPSLVHRGLMTSIEEAIGGFLLVVTSLGKVVYITEAVESFFGYTQVDLLGSCLYNVIHAEDHDILKEQLDSKEDTRRSFFCRMMEKALSRNDPSRYEIIHIVGTLKLLAENCSNTVTHTVQKCNIVQTTDPLESPCSDSDEDDGKATDSNRIETHILVSFVRVVKDRPITELFLAESNQDEYITRHTMDGKILYTDHRISFVTGLMPSEVIGTSAFKYMHSEDMVWSMVAHNLMFTSSQGQGLVSYRLKCKGGSLVTLRSRGYIELNKETGQAETFVCINTVVGTKEAKEEIKNQRRKLLPIIADQQGEDHLGSVSSLMPPEFLSMMRLLMDSKTMHTLIAEMDASITQTSKSCAPKQPKKLKVSRESSVPFSLQDPVENRKESDPVEPLFTKNIPKIPKDLGEKNEKQALNKSLKRRADEELCTLLTKIQDPSCLYKGISDVSHQTYKPQSFAPLPHLSHDAIEPLLCTPSTPTKEKIDSQPRIHTEPSQGNGFKGHPTINNSNNHQFHESYHDCRPCFTKDFDNRGMHICHEKVYNADNLSKPCTDFQPERDGRLLSQSTTTSVLYSNNYAQSWMYPQYVGSTNGLNQNFQTLALQQDVYPQRYAGSYQASQSYFPSVPEFDVKLHRQQWPLHHERPHLSQDNKYPLQQRVDPQQDWLSTSTFSNLTPTPDTYFTPPGMETFPTLPTQCTTLSVDHQGQHP
ncbi:circadian locomoter output cycles protein kaput-like isoform X2 [Palaemon carinicauda]|uniref:circadian locomoter output cycles protein kaput-like isoform X2 n=1 Tax=Palaemon carinicauda TaxID=392227 RepID=UPI0035B5CC5A